MESKGRGIRDESRSRAQLLIDLDALKRKLYEMDDLEERCRQAEAALDAIEARSRLLRECAPMGVCVVDGEGWVTLINSKMSEILSLPPVQAGAPPVNLFQVSELQKSRLADMLQRCIDMKQTAVIEHPPLRPRAEGEYFRYHFSPVCDAGGASIGAIVFGEDVSELNRTEHALQDSEERYRLLFQSSPIAMMERDASALKAHIEQLRSAGVSDFKAYLARNPAEVIRCMSMIKTLSYNAAFLKLMEVSHEAALSKGLEMARFEDAEELAREIVLMMAEGGTTNEKERSLVTLKGNRKNVLAKTLVVSGHEDTYSRVVIALIDISRRKEAEDALRVSEQRFREQAMRDHLTGLYNRRYLYRTLDAMIEAGNAEGTKISIIFMDIDHFKDVVDKYGHLNGSQAIRELAVTIERSLEGPAYAVAYAGDEFVIVLPGFDAARARQKALEIKARIQEAVYLRDKGINVRLQASFGIATFPDHAADMTGLLAAADQALFEVKQNGKNAVGLYGNPTHNRAGMNA